MEIKFNKKIETLKKTQAEMKMELKNPMTQPENSKKVLTHRMNQAKYKISGFTNGKKKA